MRGNEKMLTDNIKFLLNYNRSLRNELKKYEQNEQGNIELFETKNGQYTLQVHQKGRKLLLHSKYDPIKEAERLVEQYADNIDGYEHVFFYGIGLGYHVESFLNQFPDLSFTLYEPNPYVFNHFMSVKKIEDLPIKNLKHLFIETSEMEAKQFLASFSNNLQENVLLVTLPSYERAFSEQFKAFTTNFKDSVKNKRSALHTNIAFEKRWTLNSLMNFPEVLKTPNILHDVDKVHFKNKAAIIVAAGPSLNEELENLRYIKENGLAYIFAVGSANRTLIQNNIKPDAVCTYDPQGHNYKVYEEMIDNQIDDVPMIFGSSVGFETLQKVKGPKLHMLTSQDTVSPLFLENEKQGAIKFVQDAPSIAIVTFQLLEKLECNPIILVGQNLAYKGRKFYADGIQYDKRGIEINENELKNAIEVESVDGDTIFTSEGFNRMRIQMELFISQTNAHVINTTKSGANIRGTEYLELENVINNRLLEKVVQPKWYSGIENTYDIQLVKYQKVEIDKDKFQVQIKRLSKTIARLNRFSEKNDENSIEKELSKLDSEIKNVTSNLFFQYIIRPMIRVQYELVKQKVDQIRFHKNLFEKANMTTETFGSFFLNCKEAYKSVLPAYEQLKKGIEDYKKVDR